MAGEQGNTVNYEVWCEQLRAKNEQIEQQLAQAREENIKQDETIEFLHIVIDDLKGERDHERAEKNRMAEENGALSRELAQARALLEALLAVEPVGYGAESSIRYCPYCDGRDGGSDNPAYDPVEHQPECVWLKARAYLAQHKEQQDD